MDIKNVIDESVEPNTPKWPTEVEISVNGRMIFSGLPVLNMHFEGGEDVEMNFDGSLDDKLKVNYIMK